MISLFVTIILTALIAGFFAYFAETIPTVPPFISTIIWCVAGLAILLDVIHYFGYGANLR